MKDVGKREEERNIERWKAEKEEMKEKQLGGGKAETNAIERTS